MSEHSEASPSLIPAEPAATRTPRDQIRISARLLDVVRAIDVPLLAILAVAGFLRFWDVNWDQHTHIHPDERFLTMVGTALQIPHGIGQYLNPATSPLNPANAGCSGGQCPYTFFVYGMFPVSLNTVLATMLHNDTYDMFTIQGRVLSGIADLIVVLLVFKIVQLLERQYGLPPAVKYLAASLYAIAVLPIQLAHFFAVDTFENVFMIGALYFALRYSFRPRWLDAAVSAALFGLAIASKVSAVAILPLIAVLLALPLLAEAGFVPEAWSGSVRSFLRHGNVGRAVDRGAVVAVIYALVAYFVLRFADPYMFQSPNPLDPRLNSLFLSNIRQLQLLASPAAIFPPSVQWIHKIPFVFALTNLIFFGMGLPMFIGAVIGMYLTIMRRGQARLVIILVWVALYFLYESTRFTPTMRYFIFLYPCLTIFAAIGLYALWQTGSAYLKGGIALALLIWPAAFMSIYMHPISRVQASDWMYRTLPSGSYILNEGWDDALPLGVPNTDSKTFTSTSLPVFDPDNAPSKWYQLDVGLKRGDYLVLSSNRGWGSIPTAPERYPIMVAYYHDLFAGKPVTVPRYREVVGKQIVNGVATKTTTYRPAGTVTFRYRKVAQFASYPSLRYLGIPIDFPDQWSEEAFTVYDHPQVDIFEHVR